MYLPILSDWVGGGRESGSTTTVPFCASRTLPTMGPHPPFRHSTACRLSLTIWGASRHAPRRRPARGHDTDTVSHVSVMTRLDPNPAPPHCLRSPSAHGCLVLLCFYFLCTPLQCVLRPGTVSHITADFPLGLSHSKAHNASTIHVSLPTSGYKCGSGQSFPPYFFIVCGQGVPCGKACWLAFVSPKPPSLLRATTPYTQAPRGMLRMVSCHILSIFLIFFLQVAQALRVVRCRIRLLYMPIIPPP